MRKVRLLAAVKTDVPYICGDKDQELRLADYTAQFAVLNKLAVYIDAEPEPGPSRAELERQEAERAAAHTLRQVSEETSQSGPGADEPPKRPYGNAPKSAWIRYACEVDERMTEERAELMSKADLISRYGERL